MKNLSKKMITVLCTLSLTMASFQANAQSNQCSNENVVALKEAKAAYTRSIEAYSQALVQGADGVYVTKSRVGDAITGAVLTIGGLALVFTMKRAGPVFVGGGSVRAATVEEMRALGYGSTYVRAGSLGHGSQAVRFIAGIFLTMNGAPTLMNAINPDLSGNLARAQDQLKHINASLKSCGQ